MGNNKKLEELIRNNVDRNMLDLQEADRAERMLRLGYLAAQKEAEGLKIRLENIAELIEKPTSMTDACYQLGQIERLAREALKKYESGE